MKAKFNTSPHSHDGAMSPDKLRLTIMMAVSRIPPDMLPSITEETLKEVAALLANELGWSDAPSLSRGPLDTVAEFVDEECVVGRGHRIPIKALYDRYVAWCARYHKAPVNRNHFGRELGKIVPGIKRSRPWGDGKDRPVVYVGIGLRKE